MSAANPPKSTSTNPLRETISDLVYGGWKPDGSLIGGERFYEEEVIDNFMELLTAKTTEARIDELKRTMSNNHSGSTYNYLEERIAQLQQPGKDKV